MMHTELILILEIILKRYTVCMFLVLSKFDTIFIILRFSQTLTAHGTWVLHDGRVICQWCKDSTRYYLSNSCWLYIDIFFLFFFHLWCPHLILFGELSYWGIVKKKSNWTFIHPIRLVRNESSLITINFILLVGNRMIIGWGTTNF